MENVNRKYVIRETGVRISLSGNSIAFFSVIKEKVPHPEFLIHYSSNPTA
jgi:hypothetical protein